MKKRIIKGMLAAGMLLYCMIGQAQTSSNPVGVWNFDIPNAPAEYATGKVEFKNLDGKLMLFFVGMQGTGFEVTKKENQYTCKMSFDYFDMTFVLKADGDNLKGVVFSDQWEMDINMKPDKK